MAVSLVLYRSVDCSHLLASLHGQAVKTIYVLASAVSASDLSQLTQELADLPFESSLYVRGDNLGFAAGHNFLCSRIFENGFSHALIINPDITILDGGVRDLIEGAIACGTCPSLHAPQLRLAGSNSNDSLGIVWRRGRRHFDLGQGQPIVRLKAPTRVTGVSGAAILIDLASHNLIVAESGFLFDPLFLAYREDAELGLRMAALNGTCFVHPTLKFIHSRGTRNGKRVGAGRYLGVRNRFLMRPRVQISSVPQRGGLCRDLVVLVASALSRQERSAVAAAWRLRRQAKYRANRYRYFVKESCPRQP